MSDTPRMDATLGKGADWIFAEGCKLERELNALRANVRNIREAITEDSLRASPNAMSAKEAVLKAAEIAEKRHWMTPFHGRGIECAEAIRALAATLPQSVVNDTAQSATATQFEATGWWTGKEAKFEPGKVPPEGALLFRPVDRTTKP